MTTSITDARYTSLHFTSAQLLALSFDPPAETGWGVMPGYDEFIPVPEHLEPPQLDADETLPTQLHPSYPFGRPPTVSKPQRPWMTGPTNLLGSMDRLGPGAASGSGLISGGREGSGVQGDGWLGSRYGQGEGWRELGMESVVEREKIREVPPGMAGAKRPPSPPSPSLHPTLNPQPRSSHLRNLLARQRQSTPAQPTDPFDAPVPNETYADADLSGNQSGGMEGSLEGAALRSSVNGLGTPREPHNDEMMGEDADEEEEDL